jgi:hypothetical protein
VSVPIETMELPFALRGTRGTVQVRYGDNDDPRRWGYDLLDLPYDFERSRGFPVVEATVEHPAEGYAAAMGWIQVVRYRGAAAAEDVIVDVAPQLRGSGIPWFSFGPRPAFFDAPSTTDDDATFRADAFLAATPNALMTPVAEPLCGFSWGYDVAGGTPARTPLGPAGPERWAAMRPALLAACPGWTFP